MMILVGDLILKQYENFVNEWHYFLKDTKALLLRLSDAQLNQELSMYLLNCFYTTAFDLEIDFYKQFICLKSYVINTYYCL